MNNKINLTHKKLNSLNNFYNIDEVENNFKSVQNKTKQVFFKK